jgi:hypothetical protein
MRVDEKTIRLKIILFLYVMCAFYNERTFFLIPNDFLFSSYFSLNDN